MKKNFPRFTVIHPVLFSIFPIIFLFSNNVGLLSAHEIVLPLLIVVIPTFLVCILIGYLLKNMKKASLIVSLGLALIFSYGFFYNSIDDIVVGEFYVRHHYLLFIFLTSFVIGTYYFIKTKRKIEKVTKFLNISAIILIGISFINFVGPDEEVLPNVYYIILDSYAHSTILKQVYDYDNQEFISFLKEKGFYVASKSHSNYNQSFLSYASSLNMKYINYLSDELGIEKRNFHKPYQMVDSNEVMKFFKSKGYHIINFASRDGVTGNIEDADINLCEKNSYVDSQLLIMLIRTSILNPFYIEMFGAYNNERDLCVFSELPKLQHQTEKPIFVFAHILIPHSPWRFGPNGETLTYPPLWVEQDELTNKDGYKNQVIFVEKKIEEVIEKIFASAESPSIIVIQSDTGTSLESENQNENIKRKMKILNAYYLPENGTSLLYDTITPVNSFPIILNYYFNENFNLLEDKMYYSQHKTELNFTDVTKFLMDNTIN